MKPSFFWKKCFVLLSQGTPYHGCLLICHYYSVMTGLSLCVGVTERLTSDSLHTEYPWRPLWFVAERTLLSEWQITVAQKEWLALSLLPPPTHIGLFAAIGFLKFNSFAKLCSMCLYSISLLWLTLEHLLNLSVLIHHIPSRIVLPLNIPPIYND